jgi:hypothetical protein
MSISHAPVAKAEMLIRKPATEVFEAFVDPARRKGGISDVRSCHRFVRLVLLYTSVLRIQKNGFGLTHFLAHSVCRSFSDGRRLVGH